MAMESFCMRGSLGMGGFVVRARLFMGVMGGSSIRDRSRLDKVFRFWGVLWI